ncbi:hypothetical protein GHT06_021803 [Daphnia sinensis]|uniref:Uncharacterized protein n=1 Tax=Daphnia sinensis TaxID=1820382 RepID=A0AAD5KW12_9CRUS|nr:hypothetical protein GHT06_021803 [Daphnia sinensis]
MYTTLLFTIFKVCLFPLILLAMQCRENVEPGTFTDGSTKRLGSWWMQTVSNNANRIVKTLTEYEVASNVSVWHGNSSISFHFFLITMLQI